MVSPEARARLRWLAEERDIPQNRVIEEMIMREKLPGTGGSR